jgi:hypothetical protein
MIKFLSISAFYNFFSAFRASQDGSTGNGKKGVTLPRIDFQNRFIIMTAAPFGKPPSPH